MKKATLLLAVLTVCMYSFGQTFVSTTPSNKNVILEEYTGTNCVFCPDGHKIAQQLVTGNPDRFFAINIHQGSFAGTNPNYTTQWGNALAGQTNLTGYPSGTINRHIFPDSTKTALSRFQWAIHSSTILSTPSPVNIAAQSTIDWSTRELTVIVEVYYTGDATNTTNKLNVALLQNNILGPQTGGANYNPTMMVGSLYRHMHMLRDLITGQWGLDIPTTTTGTFFSDTLVYTVPADINNVPIKLEDIEIIAFVAEGQQEILTGAKSTLTALNAPAIYPRLDAITSIDYATCDGNAGAYVDLKNVGSDPITSVELSYTIAGGTPQTFVWDARTIPSMVTDTIHLPMLNIATGVNQIVSVTITQVNGSAYTTATPVTLTIKKKVVNGGGYMSLKLVTDRYASETTFKIFKPDGSILLQGGPWANLGSNSTTTRWFAIEPDQIGCYRFEVYDSFGDGINSGYGAGGFQVIKYDQTVLINDNGQFGSMARYMINVDEVSGVEENISTTNVNVYPNPTDGVTNIAIQLVNDAKVNVTIYNIYGQLVQVLNDSPLSQGSNNLTFNAANLSSGIYIVKVSVDGETHTKKITVR
ncbi:MAG: Omp28-related outer membrane protein [Bacteroidales bacterium]|jgi:hypothetical protein|nr:Omp28-related outer membrane protein [Bacteroidales bacterium]